MDRKELKKLTKYWEKILEKEGLGDIENHYGALKSWHSWRFMDPSTSRDLDATQEYYRRCEHFFNAYAFHSYLEYKIWQMHTKAISMREISKQLRINRARGTAILGRLKEEMGAWTKIERITPNDF